MGDGSSWIAGQADCMADYVIRSRDGDAVRRVRTRTALVAGRGLRAAFVQCLCPSTQCRACPALRARNICLLKIAAVLAF